MPRPQGEGSWPVSVWSSWLRHRFALYFFIPQSDFCFHYFFMADCIPVCPYRKFRIGRQYLFHLPWAPLFLSNFFFVGWGFDSRAFDDWYLFLVFQSESGIRCDTGYFGPGADSSQTAVRCLFFRVAKIHQHFHTSQYGFASRQIPESAIGVHTHRPVCGCGCFYGSSGPGKFFWLSGRYGVERPAVPFRPWNAFVFGFGHGFPGSFTAHFPC